MKCYNCFYYLSLIMVHIVNGEQAIRPDYPYFQYATKSPYFVDKTMLLKDFWDGYPFLLITRPNDFGKSTNLDMARRFFQKPFNESGDDIDRTTTPDYQLFTNKSLNLKIAKDSKFVDEHFGKYFVLYFDFASVQGTSTEKIVNSVMRIVKSAITPYRWLYDKLKREYEISQNWELEFDMIYWRKLFNKTCEQENFAWTLQQVAETIKYHCVLHRMLFIDDYDAPVTRAIDYGADAEAINEFMHSIMNIFLNASDVIKPAMVVGVSRLFHNDTSNYNMNIISRCYFLNDTIYGKYFGFNEQELNRLLTASKIDKTEWNKISQHFNGYRYQDSINKTLPFYNPKAVLQYLQSKTFEDVHPSKEIIIPKLMKCLHHREFVQHILRLLMKQAINLDINFQMDAKDLHDLVQIVRSNCSELPQSTQYFTPFLDNGYLTYENASYRISNKITENRLKRHLQLFYLQTYDIKIIDFDLGKSLRSILDSSIITNEILVQLGYSLQKLLTPKLHQCLDEFKYQSIVITALYFNWKSLVDDLELKETNHSTGIIDTLAIFSRHQKIALVIKVTFCEKLEDTVREVAKYQLFEKGNAYGIDLVKYLGINFNEMKIVQVGQPESCHV